MEHGHAAAPQQLRRQDAGGLPRPVSVQHRRRECRFHYADFAGEDRQPERGEVVRERVEVGFFGALPGQQLLRSARSMATTIPEPPKIDQERLPSRGHGGGWRNMVPAGGALPRVKDSSSPPPASTGIWV